MRVFSRIALVFLLLVALAVPAVFADHYTAECQLNYVAASTAPATQFGTSPHGVFRFGSLVFVLRGQTLTTYNVTDLGDLQVAREDFMGSLGARESNGGVAFAAGYLYLSSEAGLEIFDLRNVRAGGSAPVLVSRTAGYHYRRLAVLNGVLAGVYPATDLPCVPDGGFTCTNSIDLFNVVNPATPFLVSTIPSTDLNYLGFNDVVFMGGRLWATGMGGTFGWEVSTLSDPVLIFNGVTVGTFLATNGTNLLLVGQETLVGLFNYTNISGSFFNLLPVATYTLPSLQVDHSNPLMFHRQAWIDDVNGRVITLVDEKDPLRLTPARSLAFDVFDMTIPLYTGFDPRLYETVTYTTPDEVKHNPVAVGPYVYVIGEMSGLQTWGACGQMTGRIEFESTQALNCGGSEIHGWVTGTDRIASVEVFLDGTSLGLATMSGPLRDDVSSRTPVSSWRIPVNLDNTTKGNHLLRVVGTDILGNRRQFGSQQIIFNGPGANCVNRRRGAAKN